MIRGGTILWAGLALIAGTGLFLLKYEVQAEEQRLSALRRDIVRAEESIHVLKAEWSYLNEPQRLREQAERHLGLHSLKPSQIGAIASLPVTERRTVDATVAPPATPVPVPVPDGRNMVGSVQTQPAPAAPATPPPSRVQDRSKAPPPAAKPGRTMTAALAPDHPAKPAKPATAPAAVKQAPAWSPPSRQAYVAPAIHPVAEMTETTRGNVMVITSPALMQPEMASTRAKP